MGTEAYKYSRGEPTSTHMRVTSCMPALLQSQFQVFGDDNLKAIDRRMKREDAMQLEASRIQERCAQSRERLHEESQRRVGEIEKRAARRAKAAELVAERRLRTEFCRLCRW